LHKVLENIGASNMVSELDIKMIVDELGTDSQSTTYKDTIQLPAMFQIL